MSFQPENRIELPPELAELAERWSFLEDLDRTVLGEFQNQRSQDLQAEAEMAQEETVGGNLTSYITQETLVTPGRVLPNRHLKSAWFRHAAHLGLEDPAILSFQFDPLHPDEKEAEKAKETSAKEVKDLLDRLGQQPQLWTAAEKVTVFTARPSATRFLPQDVSPESQDSASGLVVSPEANPGKIAKRLRAYSGAPGVFFDPRPSEFPLLHIGGEIPYRVKVRDSGTVGDGGGACPQSIAKEILAFSGVPLWGDIIAFQVVVLGKDFSFKALINIVPDEGWDHPRCDLLIDAKSVNHQVHSTKVTVGKLMPTRHKRNRRHFYVEPMNLGEVVNRHIAVEQLAEQALVIAENTERQNWERALARSDELRQELLEDFQDSEETAGDSSRRSSQRVVHRQPEEKNNLMLAYETSGRSPFALPPVTSLVAEGPSRTRRRELHNSRKRSGEYEPEERPVLTGITVSGEKLLLMDPGYAGVTYPRRGYVRLIWHHRRVDQLIGIGLSKADTLELRDAFDGMDVDGDKLQLIPMEDDRGKPQALLMRSPMSIDGGACLRLTLEDARSLRALWYHFYQCTGGHKHPGLHRIEKGVQRYPDVLHADRTSRPLRCTTDPEQMVHRMLEINRHRWMIGAVTLTAANLDFAGLYDPSRHKFNASEEIIDPSLDGNGDPSPVLAALDRDLVEATRRGAILDPCLFPRMRKKMRGMLKELHTGEEFSPRLECQPHHLARKAGQEAAIRFLEHRFNDKALLAHGPAEWLTTRFGGKLCNLVVRALETRMAIWAAMAREEELVWDLPHASHRQKEAMVGRLIQEAKEAEAALIRTAHRQAVEAVDNLEPGQFMAAWVQASVSRAK